MHESNTSSTDKKKLYSLAMIFACSFLGGPFGGFYMIGRNYKVSGDKKSAQNATKMGLLATLILFGIIPFVPQNAIDRIPPIAIPLAYSLAVYFYAKRLQGPVLDTHFKKGGQKESVMNSIGIMAMSFLISMLYMMVLYALLPEGWLATVD